MRYLDRYKKALKIGGERSMQGFFESCHRPLHVVFNKGWNAYFVLPQFQFGADYQADFLIMSAHSGAWHACFVELESPNARLYLKDGTESRELRTAVRQVKDWARWVQRGQSTLIQALKRGVRLARDRGQQIEANPVNLDGVNLFDHDAVILASYAIIIGRSRLLSSDDNARRSIESHGNFPIEIVTYDRFLNVLEQDLKNRRERQQSHLAYKNRWRDIP